MFDRLIEYLRNLPEEEMNSVDLESIAVATALKDSHPPGSSGRQSLEFLDAFERKWLEKKAYLVDENNPRRMQLLLRKILDKMILEGIPSLCRAELDVLINVEVLISQDVETDQFERLHTLFSRSKDLLQKRRQELSEAPGLANLENYITYISSRDILDKPVCTVTEFGQIELKTRGHYLSHRGDLRILDTVPDSGIVSVEKGSCLVSGHVLGHVYASNSVEVLKNISGTVIASENEIRGTNAINRSYLVSKWGSVILNKAEEPTLVFAGEKISIVESARLGVFASPEITVGGSCTGGEYSVSRSLEAQHFSETPTRKLIIEFPEKVSCDWYGGLIPREAERIISEIRNVISRLENTRNLAQIAFDECEHYAANGLIYLMGGDSLINQIEEVARAHRRLAFLNRITNGIDVLNEAATTKIRSQLMEGVHLDSLSHFMGGLRDVDDEMKRMRLEDGLDVDLSEETNALQSVSQVLNRSNAIESSVVHRLKDKRTFWAREKRELVQQIKESEEALRKLSGNIELLESSNDSTTKVTLLGKILQKAKTLSPSAALVKRSRSTFTQIIVRSIENRKNHIKAYKTILTQLADQYKLLCSELKRNHHMPPPKEIEEEVNLADPFVRGGFDENVILCTQKFMIPKDILAQGSAHSAAVSGVHVVKESMKFPSMFVRSENEIHETTSTS